MILLLLKLLVGHALCDYPLQGDFMAKFKNPREPFPEIIWPWLLGCHCLIHAAAVYWVTGLWWCAYIEFVHHAVCDFCKSMGWITFNQDQIQHVAIKFVFAGCVGLSFLQ